MKQMILSVLKKTGWELRRIGSMTCSTMSAGLLRLSSHNLQVQTVLDVGASNGSWSKECMTHFPDASYVLFEPQPVHCSALGSFAEACRQKVVIVNKAVGAVEGETYFDATDPFGGALLSSGEGDKTIKVPLTTIDTCVSQHQMDGPFLIKLDTHGFERSILNGAAKALERTGILIIEAYNHRITDEAFLFWELCDFLAQKGFRPFDLVDVMNRPHDKSLWQMDLFFIRSDWHGFNHTLYD